MLFNSYEFIFVFLPVTLLSFFFICRRNHEIALVWLVGASLFYYGWWNPRYLALFLLSMMVNFSLGRMIGSTLDHRFVYHKRTYLVLGIVLNLGALGYFKYAGFLVENINIVLGVNINMGQIVLPLAISFFTFQQIAYLVDAYRGIAREHRFFHYALFVCFFPQLIAGPIVHHKEMLPEFMRKESLRPQIQNIVVGLTIFFIGLFKKAVLADGVAYYGKSVFNAAANGESLTFFIAWGGALAYTLQLYFDFSGYSDMAIGCSRLFGIRLPLNFHSPYKATNIIEFWRRWHMTLSRFLRDYVYIPMGGNRSGRFRRYLNLGITMLLGGMWHGAGWTFLIWGCLHGVFLIINHVWHTIKGSLDFSIAGSAPAKFAGWLITFTAVVVGWVFFRADGLKSAIVMLRGMAGLNGFAIPMGVLVRLGTVGDWVQRHGVDGYMGGGGDFVATYLWIGSLMAVVLLMPNTQQIMSRFDPALEVYVFEGKSEIRIWKYIELLKWRTSYGWSIAVAVIAAMGILALTNISEFLYFQF